LSQIYTTCIESAGWDMQGEETRDREPLVTRQPTSTFPDIESQSFLSKSGVESQSFLRNPLTTKLAKPCTCSSARGVPLSVTVVLILPLLVCTYFASTASQEGHDGIHPWFIAIVSNCTESEWAKPGRETCNEPNNGNNGVAQALFYYDKAYRAKKIVNPKVQCCTVLHFGIGLPHSPLISIHLYPVFPNQDPSRSQWVPDKSVFVRYEDCMNDPTDPPPRKVHLLDALFGWERHPLNGHAWSRLHQLGKVRQLRL
jgi:hypothetical protein